ncbi:MAG TPA: hypothetical protein VF077_12735 [Nitrospiraceae bacterium]
MVVPQGGRVTLYWNINGELAINQLGTFITGSVTFNQALADTIGSAVKGHYLNTIAGLQSPPNALVRVGIRDLRADNLAEFRDTSPAQPATGTGDSMPGKVAACFTLRTAGAGKSFRGRVFLSGWNEAQNSSSGQAVAIVGTNGIAFLNAVNGTLTGNGMQLAQITVPQEDVRITRTTTHSDGTSETKVLSHQTAKPGAAHPVIAIQARTANWESQRRRGDGRGVAPTSLAVVAEVTL